MVMTDDDTQKQCLEHARAAEQELKEFLTKRSEMDVIHVDVNDDGVLGCACMHVLVCRH